MYPSIAIHGSFTVGYDIVEEQCDEDHPSGYFEEHDFHGDIFEGLEALRGKIVFVFDDEVGDDEEGEGELYDGGCEQVGR